MPHPLTGTVYGATSIIRFSSQQVRERRFKVAGLRRRGYDRQDVDRFLGLVADELAVSRIELAQVREENERIKQALRRWQAEQSRAAR